MPLDDSADIRSGANRVEPVSDPIADGSWRLLHAAARTAIQEPVEAVAEILDKSFGVKGPVPHLVPPKPKSVTAGDGWWQAGTAAGTLVEFLALHKVMRNGLVKMGVVLPVTPVTALESAALGATIEVLRPVGRQSMEPSSYENMTSADLWRLKTPHAIRSALVFGTMTSSTNTLHTLGLMGRIGRRPILASVAANGIAGFTGGWTDNLVSQFQGHDPPGLSSIVHFTTYGVLMGLVEGSWAKYIMHRSHKALIAESEKLAADLSGASRESLESPLLSWIAENRPSLRPPNYAAWRQNASSQLLDDLSLIDWPVTQRGAVLREVMELTRSTRLATPTALDRIIERLPEQEMRAFSEALSSAETSTAYSAWQQSSQRLRKFIEADPALREMRIQSIVQNETLHSRNPELRKLLTEVDTAESAYQKHLRRISEQSGLKSAMERRLNRFANDVGLPDIGTFSVDAANAGASYAPFGGAVRLGEFSLNGGRHWSSAEVSLHELVHHEQGLPYNWFARQPGVAVEQHRSAQHHILREMQLLAEPSGPQSLLTRMFDRGTNTNRYLTAGGGIGFRQTELATLPQEELSQTLRKLLEQKLSHHHIAENQEFMNYVGSASEKPAWAVGYLTQLRAQLRGLPDPPAEVLFSGPRPFKISEHKPEPDPIDEFLDFVFGSS